MSKLKSDLQTPGFYIYLVSKLMFIPTARRNKTKKNICNIIVGTKYDDSV